MKLNFTRLLISILFLPLMVLGQVADKWTQKTDFGSIARRNCVGFSIGNKGYIGLGNNGTIGNQKDFWEYDPTTDTWTQKADFPGGARIGSTGFGVGSKGYVGLGAQSLRNKDFYEFTPSTNTWKKLSDFGGDARAFATCFTIGNKAYVGTGDSGYTAFGRIIHFADFWEYTPSTDTWTKKADFGGGARWRAVGFSIAGMGYIGTGTSSASEKKDFYGYDPSTDTWTKKADFGGYPEGAASGFSIGGMGYIGTGHDYTSAYKNDFWMYDPIADSWTEKANFGGGKRMEAVGFSIGTKGYLGTGLYGPEKKDFWEYNPDSIITHSPKSSSLCEGDSFKISFISSQIFNTTNTFQVQLSNSTSSFSSATIIGSLSSTSTIDSIVCYIPLGTSVGSGYRVRVTSSSPIAIGIDNGVNISINTKVIPSISISASDTILCDGDSVTLKAKYTFGGSAPKLQWKLNNTTVGKNDTIFKYKPKNNDSVSCILSSNAICRTFDSVLSNTMTIQVNPLPIPTILLTDTSLSTQSFTSYQWYFNSLAITGIGGTSQVLKIIGDGDYYVFVTDTNGCANFSLVTKVKTTFIDETRLIKNIFLFPNPAKNIVFISSPKLVNIHVLNVLGQQVLTSEKATTINLSNLVSGNYFFKIYDTEGTFIGTKQISKFD